MSRARLAVAGALVVLLQVVAAFGTAGPARADSGLSVSSRTVTVSSQGRSFSALLVQPTGSRPGAYPVVTFGHGFAQSASRYGSTLNALAARGYIVIAPNSQTGLLPSHSAFAKDLGAAIAWGHATQPNAHPTLDAVLGHSMGGGAAVLAASANPGIDTVATLAAANTNPSAATAARSLSVPALFVVGSSDSVVKPSNTRAIYDAAPSPATWVSITGGYHCGFLDSSSFFGLGCDNGSISRSQQLALSNTLLGDWLDATLKSGPAFNRPVGTTGEQK